ncbi:COG3415 family protein [Aquimarina agarilytica]|uniref:hypothetical protein n=1 Tax=Aquimarina agarilytica TaxID=1087449 RepID=UPI00028A10F0|nr:hypothetical protein [Aquimarina agarilytica]
MPKSSTLIVKESLPELQSLLRKQDNPKNILRLQSLIHIKEARFKRRSELASHLGYNIRSMELWLKDYRDKGLAGLLIPVKEKQKRTRHVNKEIHEELEKRLNDPRLGFSSYVEALQWVNNTFETSIQYATLRNYMIEFFGTKIKQPRKSHIKKSEEAKADFLKLT